MIDRVAIDDEPAASPPEAAPNGPAAEALEYRVRRLEDAVAGLQDTREMEDRIVERVARRIGRNAMQVVPDSASAIVDAGRRLLPKAIEAARLPEREPAPAPKTSAVRPEWLLIDAYEEARAMFHMFFDQRYRPNLTWTARIVPPLLLIAILTSWLWVPGTGILFASIATVLDKLVDIFLAYFLYKVLSREARRYREMFSG